MNIIYHGDNINIYEILEKSTGIKIENNKNFKIVDSINNLIVDFEYYKKKDSIYITRKLEDSICNNFSKYKKNIVLMNLRDKKLQKYIKNNLRELSSINKIIFITRDINDIIGELRNSFHIIHDKVKFVEYKYEPIKMLVDESFAMYKRDLESLEIKDVENIKNIAYKICKYDISVKRYMSDLLDKFIKDPYFTFDLVSRIIKIVADGEYKMKKSYRILIHVENLLITIYDEIITFYQ